MTYNEKGFAKLMKTNGYILDRNRGKGSHRIYVKGSNTISIGDHYNKMVIKRLIKENNLLV